MQTQNAPATYDDPVPRKPMRNRLYREGDVYYLAAQMQAELDERRLAEVVRDHIREYGAAWHDAARTAWADLEAAAPEGREPTKEQVAAFLVRFGREHKAIDGRESREAGA